MTLALTFDLFQSFIGDGTASRTNAFIGSSRTGEVDAKVWSERPSKNNNSGILESKNDRYL